MAIKGIGEVYWGDFASDIRNLKPRIDYMETLGFNTYVFEIKPEYIGQTKANAIDYIQEAIAHAHSKGMKIRFRISWYKWATNEDRYLFYTTPANKAAFLADFEWIVSRYPTVDGIGIEEPLFNGAPAGTQGAIDFWNDLHTRLNTIVTTYRDISNPDLFQWEFGLSSNVPANILRGGTDLEFIKSNHLYNTYTISNGGLNNQTLSEYIIWIDLWKGFMPGYRIENWVYITDDGIRKGPLCNLGWSGPGCFNQGFFDQLKYSVQNNIHVFVFHADLFGRPNWFWPNDTTPGANATEKMTYILNLSSECPTPQYTYNITQE